MVELDQGVLTARCADPRWAPELTRARETVLKRLQELLGPDAVVRLKVVGPE
jgi:predicted nucleic acid-binding Zn ribbon protein